jgi:hypothetical protein
MFIKVTPVDPKDGTRHLVPIDNRIAIEERDDKVYVVNIEGGLEIEVQETFEYFEDKLVF